MNLGLAASLFMVFGALGMHTSYGDDPLSAAESLAFFEHLPATLTVKVGSKNCNTAGTAFFVSADGIAVTNKHVLRCLLKGNAEAKLVLRGHPLPFNAKEKALLKGQTKTSLQSILNRIAKTLPEVEMAICGKSLARDLCLFRVQNTYPSRWFKLSKIFPKEGTPVFTIGNPDGKGLIIDSGTFLARRNHSGVSEVDVSIQTRSGSSGGPVFTSEGLLLGVHYLLRTVGVNTGPSGWQTTRTEHNSISAFEIQDLLDRFVSTGGRYMSVSQFRITASPQIEW